MRKETRRAFAAALAMVLIPALVPALLPALPLARPSLRFAAAATTRAIPPVTTRITPAPLPTPPPSAEELDRIWENRRPGLIESIHSGFTGNPVNPQVLYNTQLYTNNLLRSAVQTTNLEQLDELAELYLAAYQHLTFETRYVYYYWPGEARESIHDLETPARMWLGDPAETDNGILGIESILISSQFLYPVASLIHAIAALPPSQRSARMLQFTADYLPVLLDDHYQRWIFAGQGVFQRRGWGAPEGLYNHSEHLARLLNREYQAQVSYINVVTDTDLWIIAGVTELLAAHASDTELVPMSAERRDALLDHVALGTLLLQDRISQSSLTDFAGAPVTGINFDLGEWDDHPDYAYAGYEGAESPLGKGWDPIPAQDVGWDISHARRFVNLFESLYRNRIYTGQSFPDDAILAGLAAQLVYGAGNHDLDQPLFANFMDGQNGWYRVGYHEGFPGYSPYGMGTAFTTGGYGFWAEFNPDVALLRDRLWEEINALFTRDLSGNRHWARVDGGAWQPGPGPNGSSGYVAFPGGSGYVDGDSDPVWSMPRGTIEFWFRPDAAGRSDDLVNIFTDGYYNFLLIRRREDNTLLLYIEEDDTAILNLSTVDTVAVGAWNHIAVTQDGAAATLYINGVETLTTGSNSGAWSDHLASPRAWFGKGHWFTCDGAMDDIRLYDRPLSPAEIAADMGGARPPAGINARWEFDQQPDQEAIDFMSLYYSADYSRSSSLDLLMFLPVFF